MLKDKVKKCKFFICVNIILATIIGVYAQGITSYVVGDYLLSISGFYYIYPLTILTVLSIVLFLTTPILIYRFIKKYSIEKQIFTSYLIANTLIGIPTSIFSIFVLIMSWG